MNKYERDIYELREKIYETSNILIQLKNDLDNKLKHPPRELDSDYLKRIFEANIRQWNSQFKVICGLFFAPLLVLFTVISLIKGFRLDLIVNLFCFYGIITTAFYLGNYLSFKVGELIGWLFGVSICLVSPFIVIYLQKYF